MGKTAGDLQQAPALRVIRRQAESIIAAVAPFGIVFGGSAATAGLTLFEAIGFSVLIFGGSSQFAAAEILGDGGSIASAVVAGLLLNVRSLAFGVIMAPALSTTDWVSSPTDGDQSVSRPGTSDRFRRRWVLTSGE